MLLNILSGVAEVITIVATGLFANNNCETTNSEVKEENKTYDYWMSLSYIEQKEYFESNEYLKDYLDTDFYENNRHYTALHVQQIADRLNKEFTNKYYRY